jgi:transposase
MLRYALFRYSLLPALALDGMIYAKVVEGSFTSLLFRDFLKVVLDHMQPFPAPKSVIVMDNAQIHKDPAIIEMIEQRYMSIHSTRDFCR